MMGAYPAGVRRKRAVNPKIAVVWDTLKASYWFRPSLHVLVAIGIALALLQVDHVVRLPRRSSAIWWFYTGSEQDAGVLLETIATSVMTVAGVTFSMSIAALSMASQTYGPRLLRGFMRDAGDQSVFGIFLGTFAYCIVVLRSLHSAQEVPTLAVFAGSVLAMASVGALIFYIHHLTRSMEPEAVIDSVGAELDRCIGDLYPEPFGDAPEASDGKPAPDMEAIRTSGERVKTDREGYVQVVDVAALMRLAIEHDLTILVVKQPGHYSVTEGTLAIASPREHLNDRVMQQIRSKFVLAGARNVMQDAEYAVNQLTEIIVHALSPGINNPFTAAIGIDRLSASLAKLAMRRIPSAYRYDGDGRLRVIAYPVTFVHLLQVGLGAVRRYAGNARVVYQRLIVSDAEIAQHAFREGDRLALRAELHAILDAAQRHLTSTEDWNSVRDEVQRAFEVLDAGTNPPPSVITSMKER